MVIKIRGSQPGELPKMMAVASDIFVGVQRRKASRDRGPEKAPPAKKAKGGFRQRDPL